jgi:hypothetical protein
MNNKDLPIILRKYLTSLPGEELIFCYRSHVLTWRVQILESIDNKNILTKDHKNKNFCQKWQCYLRERTRGIQPVPFFFFSLSVHPGITLLQTPTGALRVVVSFSL